MKAFALLMVFIFLKTSILSQEFSYKKDLDLFEYLQDTRAGLSSVPGPSANEPPRRAMKEGKALRESVNQGKIDIAELKNIALRILDQRNYTGFIHFSAAMGRTGKDVEIMALYANFLTNDNPKRNFSVLYGAVRMRVASRLSDEIDRKLDIEIRKIIKKIKRDNIPIEKTARFPDLVQYIEDYYLPKKRK